MRSLGVVRPPAEICHYLPGQMAQLEYELVAAATRAEYGQRLRDGWRRFGHALFRPVCASCTACLSLRVPVAAFSPNRSQRRAWAGNRDQVMLTIGLPSASPEKQRLFDAFHRFQAAAKGWPEAGSDYEDMFVRNPFATEEWCYSVDGRLVAVGYMDCVPDGLSAIYFFYDPEERHRSLGTFNILAAIDRARSLQLPFVYLGYFVEGCQSLEYKARFQPNEALLGGAWRPFKG